MNEAHEWDSCKTQAREWDFREGAGSKIAGSFVAMKRASRRAGEACLAGEAP